MTLYDEVNKVWYAKDQQPESDFQKWSAQQLLDKLSAHGRKVAQVTATQRSTKFSSLKIEF